MKFNFLFKMFKNSWRFQKMQDKYLFFTPMKIHTVIGKLKKQNKTTFLKSERIT